MNPLRRSLLCSCGFILLCPLLAGCRPQTPPPMPLNQLNAQQRRGYQDFHIYCSQCHDDRDADSLHGPPLLGVFKQPYLPSGAPANDERVVATIRDGHGLMPPIDMMDSQQMQDLLAYLHTL
ncbi:MAG: c-type cytochrome [Acidobacteriaceae bacterium]